MSFDELLDNKKACLPLVFLQYGFNQLIKLLMHGPCCQLTRQHQEKSWKRRDSNPGRWDAELERYHCAMATPLLTFSLNLSDYACVRVALARAGLSSLGTNPCLERDKVGVENTFRVP